MACTSKESVYLQQNARASPIFVAHNVVNMQVTEVMLSAAKIYLEIHIG